MTESVPLIIRTFHYPDDYAVVFKFWNEAGLGIHVRRSDEAREIEQKLQRDPDLYLVAELEGESIPMMRAAATGWTSCTPMARI